MTHLAKDEYGWWNKPLPTTYGHINNYVLTLEELKAYEEELKQMRTAVESEYNEVVRTLRVLSSKQVKSYETYPVMHSLSSALEFFVRMGKRKLAITALLNKVTERGKHDACR